jgi:hypothetical protein
LPIFLAGVPEVVFGRSRDRHEQSILNDEAGLLIRWRPFVPGHPRPAGKIFAVEKLNLSGRERGGGQ